LLATNRYSAIKDNIKRWAAMTVGAISLSDVGMMLTHLQELAAEIDRRDNIPRVKTNAGPRPVILDAKGAPVLPNPLVQQFEGQRRDQYALDRHMAVMSLDPDQWRIFSLRWGLTPPPGGWENTEAIVNVMHAVRLVVKSVPYIDKHFSAVHMKANGIALPPGMWIEGGVLHGHDTDETLPS
jgi:hypothetical protein